MKNQSVPERFFVTDGDATVGPVDGDLLTRGIQTGKVPLDAMVWSTGWKQWRSVRDYADELGVLPREETAVASSRLAKVSHLYPLQLPNTAEERQTLSEARDLRHAASLMLALTAALTGADAGWVHVHNRTTGGMVTLEGLGPSSGFGVGRSIDTADQALRAARDGRTVLGEPIPGVVGSAIAARLIAAGISPTSVLMAPVLCGGQLIVMVELGITSRPSGFSACDAAVTEQVGRDLATIVRERGWHRC